MKLIFCCGMFALIVAIFLMFMWYIVNDDSWYDDEGDL